MKHLCEQVVGAAAASAVARSPTGGVPGGLKARATEAGGAAVPRSSRFTGKVVVVTGAAGGLGRAAAESFVEEGASVVMADLDLAGCEEAVQEIMEETKQIGCHGTAVAMKADVSNEADVKETVDFAVRTFGRLDVYFANAGIYPGWRPVQDSTLEGFERTMKVNLGGPFLAIKHASEAMKQNPEGDDGYPAGGAIVCVSSIAAIRADISPVDYSASKGGVVSLVRAAQGFLVRDRIRVNAIQPGGMATPLMFGMAEDLGKQGKEVLGYDFNSFPPADPKDTAKVVLFLSSDDSRTIMGQTITADGGMSNSVGLRVRNLRPESS